MKAIIAPLIPLAVATVAASTVARAIEIKTPTVAVPHVNVPQVKTPQTNIRPGAPQLKLTTPEGNSISGQGSQTTGKTSTIAPHFEKENARGRINNSGGGAKTQSNSATTQQPNPSSPFSPQSATTAVTGPPAPPAYKLNIPNFPTYWGKPSGAGVGGSGGATTTMAGTSGSGGFDNTYLRFQFGSAAVGKIQWRSAGGGTSSSVPYSFNKIDPTGKASVVSLVNLGAYSALGGASDSGSGGPTVGAGKSKIVGGATTPTIDAGKPEIVGGATTPTVDAGKSETAGGATMPVVGAGKLGTVTSGNGAAAGGPGPIQSGVVSPSLWQGLTKNEPAGAGGLIFSSPNSEAGVTNLDAGGLKRVSPQISSVARTVAPIESNVPVPMANGPGSLADVLQGVPNGPGQTYLRYQFGTVTVGQANWGGSPAGGGGGAGKVHTRNPNGTVILGDHQ
jgi:hypothetical protein